MNNTLDGDLTVRRNLLAGGNATFNGDACIKKNLVVEGWLDAPNLISTCKGFFDNEAELRSIYRRPHPGWWAIVGSTYASASIWTARRKDNSMVYDWADSHEKAPDITIPCNPIDAQIDDLQHTVVDTASIVDQLSATVSGIEANVNDNREDIALNARNISQLDTRLSTNELKCATSMGWLEGLEEQLDSVQALAQSLTSIVGEMDIADIDQAPSGTIVAVAPALYKVKANGACVGLLGRFTDLGKNQLYQILATAYTLSDEGTLNLSEGSLQTLSLYQRRYGLSAGDNRGQWTAWQSMVNICAGEGIDATVAGAEAASCNVTVEDTDDADFIVEDENGDEVFRWPCVELNLCAIGNSYSRDCLAYVPFMLESIVPGMHVSFAILYAGSCDLRRHWELAQSGAPSYQIDYYETGRGSWTTTDNKSISDLLSLKKWDIITLQQQSSASRDYATFQPYLDNIIDWISARVDYPVKLGWLLTPAYPQGYDQLQGDTSDEMMGKICQAAQSVLANTPIDLVLPCGTAIQNARHTTLDSIGDFSHLSYEGLHLQEGLPCQIAAYAATESILRLIAPQKSVFAEKTRPTQAWVAGKNIPERHGSSVGVTDANALLAQKCALQACKKPFAIHTA